jgi:hypothetical protein
LECERLDYSLSLDGEILLAAGDGPEFAGCLLAIEGDTWEKLDSLYSSGIAVAGDRLYRLLCTRSDEKSRAAGELLVYDELGVINYHRIDCLDDPHSLIYDGEYLLTPCPAVNTIFWLGLDGTVKRSWTAPGTDDAWHVNGVHIHKGRLCASAFGRFNENYGWSRDLDAPAGIVFDVESQDDIVSGLCCPHDPQRVDGGWMVCNSRPGDLLFLDESGSIVRKVNMGGWTRGLAVSERYIFVGVSGERHAADPSHGAIAVLDRKTWAPLARLTLPCVELFSLSLAPRKFLRGLRRGFRTNATRVAAQDREDMFRRVGNIRPQGGFTPMDALPPDDCRCIVTAQAPSEVLTGAALTVEVAVTNCGPATLLTAPPRPIHLGYRWSGLDAWSAQPQVDYLRFRLPQALAPGGTLKWDISLTTPSTAGSYDLALSLVQEWVAWFDELDSANGCKVRVNVRETAS